MIVLLLLFIIINNNDIDLTLVQLPLLIILSLRYSNLYRTALHLACVNGSEEMIRLLLTNSAKTNLCDNYGRTPLMKVR